MSRILFYSPFNQRSRDAESLMIAFHRQGHMVFSLSQQEGYVINDFLNSYGIKASSHVLSGERSGWLYYLRHLFFLIRFCWTKKIDVIYSHLEPANFVASIAQYFIKGKTYLVRHHIDEGSLYRFDKDLYYRITYRLAKKIIVVSESARKYMIEYEKIPSQKIIHINLAYDFRLYEIPDKNTVDRIKNLYPASILLVSACRLTTYKRPDLAIRITKKILDEGLDVKLILLGKGEMEKQLQILIQELNLQNRIFMPGYVSNVMEFMAASDFFIHASILDSSCVTVKEAGLVELPVIVCQGIGDFDDYIVHRKNGFLLNSDSFLEEAAATVQRNFKNKELLESIGKNLFKSVHELFNIENIIVKYDSLNNI